MPSGTTHQKIYRKYTWVPYVAVIYVLAVYQPKGEWLYCLLATPIGWHLGLWIDPDLDMKGNTRAKEKWRRTIILLPMVWWWQVYAWVCWRWLGGHRSLLTHLPGVSSAIRLIWFILPGMLCVALIPLGRSFQADLIIGAILGLWIGLTLSDTIHVSADIGLLR